VTDSASYYEQMVSIGSLSRRRSDLVAFIGRKRGSLIDNVKYLYLYAATHDCGFEPVFMTGHAEELQALRALDLPVMKLGSVVKPDAPWVKTLTTAGVLVMDDLPSEFMDVYCLGVGAQKLQLWHGIPLKKIGFPEVESGVNMPEDKAEYLRFGYSCADVVLSTSPWVTETLFSRVFRAKAFIDCGYPRNDVLLRTPGKHDLINTDMHCYAALKKHKREGGKVVVYMPTWRDTGVDFLDEQGNFVLDPRALSEFSRQHNVLFVLKLHPYVDDRRLGELPGIVRFASDQDIYPALHMADALMTDYSAIYFDFLLVNKPIVFFAYDLPRYLAQDREMFFPYESMTPGPIARTHADALDALRAALFDGVDVHAQERETLRDKVFAYQDAGASERICRYIKDAMLPDATGN